MRLGLHDDGRGARESWSRNNIIVCRSSDEQNTSEIYRTVNRKTPNRRIRRRCRATVHADVLRRTTYVIRLYRCACAVYIIIVTIIIIIISTARYDFKSVKSVCKVRGTVVSGGGGGGGGGAHPRHDLVVVVITAVGPKLTARSRSRSYAPETYSSARAFSALLVALVKSRKQTKSRLDFDSRSEACVCVTCVVRSTRVYYILM